MQQFGEKPLKIALNSGFVSEQRVGLRLQLLTRVLTVTALFVGQCLPAMASNQDPIETAMDTCLAGDAGNTNAGMLGCINTACVAWDKRLNIAYQALMKTLDPASQTLLRTAQRSWLAYRKNDSAFADGPWRSQSGTDAEVAIASANLGELEARVHTLETYGSGE